MTLVEDLSQTMAVPLWLTLVSLAQKRAMLNHYISYLENPMMLTLSQKQLYGTEHTQVLYSGQNSLYLGIL